MDTGAVEVSDADGIRVTLIGITDTTNIDDQLGISVITVRDLTKGLEEKWCKAF